MMRLITRQGMSSFVQVTERARRLAVRAGGSRGSSHFEGPRIGACKVPGSGCGDGPTQVMRSGNWARQVRR